MLEAELATGLHSLADYPLVDHVRAGTSVLGALQLDAAALTTTQTLPSRVFVAARERRLAHTGDTGSMTVSSALTATEARLDLLTTELRAALDDVRRAHF